MKCWEFRECGREGGGTRADELGVCPAWPNYGDRCAHVVGTLCAGEIQGTLASKLATCLKCDFYLSEHYRDPEKDPAPGADDGPGKD